MSVLIFIFLTEGLESESWGLSNPTLRSDTCFTLTHNKRGLLHKGYTYHAPGSEGRAEWGGASPQSHILQPSFSQQSTLMATPQ